MILLAFTGKQHHFPKCEDPQACRPFPTTVGDGLPGRFILVEQSLCSRDMGVIQNSGSMWYPP